MISEKLRDFTQKIMFCSGLEEETFRFYQSVARKMDAPELRSQVVGIGYDSLKHSVAMKEIVKAVDKSELKPQDRPKAILELSEEVNEVCSQINELPHLSNREFMDVFKALTELEDRLAELYLEIYRPKILRVAADELDPRGPINLKSLSRIFEDIIRDKRNHRDVLFDVGYCFASKEQTATNTAPMVRYTNPDRWAAPQAF